MRAAVSYSLAARLAVLTCACMCRPAPLSADSPLRDPGIPDGETAVYSVQTGELRTTFTERITVEGGSGGVFRFLGGLFPRTYYWYSVAAPHYLVAFEGTSGFPGSPKSYVEIVSYSGWH